MEEQYRRVPPPPPPPPRTEGGQQEQGNVKSTVVTEQPQQLIQIEELQKTRQSFKLSPKMQKILYLAGSVVFMGLMVFALVELFI